MLVRTKVLLGTPGKHFSIRAERTCLQYLLNRRATRSPLSLHLQSSVQFLQLG
jgi:hypothetical protein